ncbi:MAG TPA: zinc-binding dehydrogenase [Candidatus Binatia bacterium]|nr:zinc-binding dehydrogenase [Candidatus Binatia bacterium]
MRALVFENSMPRLAATRILAALSSRAFVGPLAPMTLKEIPDPQFPAPDWLTIRTNLCGLCGSDYKQVFLKGRLNNPMTALVSFPQVLGHEVVGVIDGVGPAVKTRKVGERVVLNPWLSCGPRGITPPCSWCARGEYAQCENFTRGTIDAGIHHGNSRQATGGFAPLVPAHEAQCIPIPEDIPDAAAVLADPFSVSLHAILHHPPVDGGTALVYGCGTLGLLAVAILRLLHPNVRICAVARFDHQAELARGFGAERVIMWRPTKGIIDAVSEFTGAALLTPWHGQPMLNGGVDVIYDSVATAETLEVGVRVTRARGRIVVTGVEMPQQFEWTPLYFKELSIIGSNAFAIEEYGGRRQHAMEWYFEFIRTKRLDVTPIITHRYHLDSYKQAFMTCYDQGQSKAVKVLFEYER